MNVRRLIITILLLMSLSASACSSSEVAQELDTERASGAASESADTSADVEPADEAPELVNPTGSIPIQCFASDEDFASCDEQGLLPDECFDDEGFLLDACLPSEESSADTASASTQGTPLQDSVVPGVDAVSLAFDPFVDSFGFFNYGGEEGVVNLTPVEMQRMFGFDVCANVANGCTLTPPARQWMMQMNEAMAGGHCEGMAVLSSLFYFDQLSPNDFGANITSEIPFQGNEFLQREIAYWWVTQATDPGASKRINESPRAVVDALKVSFEQDQSADEWWAMGIYKRDFSGGHAITPYAVEEITPGIYSVYLYDNNYPLTTRVMTIDYDANTWQYEASTNPDVQADLYEGDASTETLELVAISPRLGTQQQFFGDADRASLGNKSSAATPAAPGAGGIEIWLDGEANLLITAPNGSRLGWLEDGSFVNEIEGASSNPLKFLVDVWDVDNEAVYRLPADMTEFTIAVDGSQLEEVASADVTLIGPGFNMVVEEILLGPGEQDIIDIFIEDDEFFTLRYSSEYSDSPDIWFGLVTDEADYEFVTRAASIEPGGAFNVALDFENGDFILNTFDQQEYGIYEFLLLRIDDEGEQVFGHNDIELLPDDTMYVNFLEWDGEGSSLYIDYDYESDGSIDDSVELEDEADFYDDFYDF